jgi:hypothetical protein
MTPDWPLERFRSLLRLQVLLMRHDPRFQRRVARRLERSEQSVDGLLSRAKRNLAQLLQDE